MNLLRVSLSPSRCAYAKSPNVVSTAMASRSVCSSLRFGSLISASMAPSFTFVIPNSPIFSLSDFSNSLSSSEPSSVAVSSCSSSSLSSSSSSSSDVYTYVRRLHTVAFSPSRVFANSLSTGVGWASSGSSESFLRLGMCRLWIWQPGYTLLKLRRPTGGVRTRDPLSLFHSARVQSFWREQKYTLRARYAPSYPAVIDWNVSGSSPLAGSDRNSGCSSRSSISCNDIM